MATTHAIGGHHVAHQVLQAVREASARTGTDFDFMLAKAAQESGFRATAEATGSSATGLYQFIESTWLQMVRQHGRDHGLGHYARQIEARANGAAYVADPLIRQEILDLRKNPRINALMAGEFAQNNKDHLQRHVGGRVGSTELYLAHFLGAAGATTFLRGLRADPDQSGAALFPEAAAANRSVFYGADGTARSLQQVYDWAAQRMQRGLALAGDVDDVGASRHAHYVTDGVAPSRTSAPLPGPAAFGRTATAAPVGALAEAAGAIAVGPSLSMWTVLTTSALPVPGEPGQDGVSDRA